MMTFMVIIHSTVCLLLIGIILIQAGRGGGLVDSFAGVESMFGTKTNTFLTRTTAALSVIFFITCLSLAFLSVRQSRSLLRDIKIQKVEPAQIPAEPAQIPQEPAQAPEAPKAE